MRVYYALTAKGVRRLFDLTDEWNRLQGAVARALRPAD
jgi:DNA-binding PadR family transcriptional regulator